MRKKIWKVLKNLEKEKINTNEAYSQLCDLYSVVGQSEQLCCEDIESAKCLTCGNETCLDAECLQ
tara:strand:- start:2455 stop:2649 length:195 start_codon:yes stop_codon:yes gene_type:complete